MASVPAVTLSMGTPGTPASVALRRCRRRRKKRSERKGSVLIDGWSKQSTGREGVRVQVDG